MTLPLIGNIPLWIILPMALIFAYVVFSVMCERRAMKKVQSTPKNSALLGLKEQFDKSEITHDEYEQEKFELIKKHLCIPSLVSKMTGKGEPS